MPINQPDLLPRRSVTSAGSQVRRRLARRAFAGWSALAIAATATVAIAVPAQATTPNVPGSGR